MIDEVVTDPDVLAEMEMIFAAAERKTARRRAARGPVVPRRPSDLVSYFPSGTPCVYVVGELDQRIVKIGWSGNLAARLTNLRCGSALPLTLLWAIDGNQGLENALHDWFDDRRIRGEWFGFPDGDAVERVRAAVGRLRGEPAQDYPLT